MVDPDRSVEDEAKNKSTTLFSSRAGYRDMIEDIGVAYALASVSSSVIVVAVDMAGTTALW